MRLWSVPPLVLALLWVFAGVALRAAGDPGDEFLQVYQSYQDGAKLETDGKYAEALQKFRFCVSVLEQIQRASPDYYPILIDSRLRKSRAAIARVQALAQAPAGGASFSPGVSSPPSAPAQAPPAPRVSQFPSTYRVPSGGEPPSGPSPSFSPPAPNDFSASAEQLMSRGAINALKDEFENLRSLVDEKNQQIEDLNRRLMESSAREMSAQKEVDLWKVRATEQQSQLAELKQSNDDLQQANGRLSRERESDQKQITALKADLESTRADLEVANEYNGELFDKLDRAAKFIDADEKIRKQLLAERQDLGARLADSSVQLQKRTKERDAAIAQKDDLQKRHESTDQLEAQNQSLSAKLAVAEKQLADFSKDRDQRQKVEADLRGEVASVTKTLASMRDELKSGRQRIVELEKQLSDTADASANVTREMAEENTLLKSLVTRQLKEQAKRQQARKLVAEEMQKLQIRSEGLIDKLNAMAGAETPLTPQEKKLVNPAVIPAGGRSDFSLEVVKKMPESDLPPDLVARASQANDLSQKHEFAAAKEIYAEIAKKAPQSYLAAVNLGIAERQLDDYPGAISAFKRALELRPGDAFALTNLGTVQYRNGDLADASQMLRQAVEADASSYLAHYLLAMALNDQGNIGGAQEEIQRSLELKPDYAPALELQNTLRAKSQPSSSAIP